MSKMYTDYWTVTRLNILLNYNINRKINYNKEWNTINLFMFNFESC